MPIMVCPIAQLALAATLAVPSGAWLLADADADGGRTPVAALCFTVGVSPLILAGLLAPGERRSANARKSSAGNSSKTRWMRRR